MTLATTLDWLERESTQLLNRMAATPRLAAAALLALTVFAYLPGVFVLPPVDRTEIVYAQSSRGMLERNDWIDATFEGQRYAFRPIGIYWMQVATGKVLGKQAWSHISTYRIPSLIAGILAVLALWRLARPVLGERRAIIAAALFAVSPIVALQATLAIPEGPLLLTIVLAQMTLLRLYCAPHGDLRNEPWLVFLFWASQGIAILLNALAVPILTLSTLIALYVMDRRVDWLWRLRPLLGIPLMALIAAPWLLIRAHFDGGVPFSELSFSELIRALGGAQDMKLKAAPLTFTLGLLLGFLPGALLLVPALQELWRNRGWPLQRFLFAWIVGYWLYLELIASKPALYTVQAMFPAAAAAVALALDQSGRLQIPPRMLRNPWWLVVAGMAVLYVGGLWFAGVVPSVPVVVGAALVTALFALAAYAATRGDAAAWLTLAVVSFALFISFTFAVLMPHMRIGWPAPRIAETIAPLQRCVIGPVGVVGFREPSTTFVLGREAETNAETVASWMAGGTDAIAIVEDRWQPDLAKALEARGAKAPPRAGCVKAFNVMRGCPLNFSIYVTGREPLDPGCRIDTRAPCEGPLSVPEKAAASRCR
jgi:4-amino-4-deoxy-L-arabinose transferase-like glycosyltransferase